jgi:hypothetical protein
VLPTRASHLTQAIGTHIPAKVDDAIQWLIGIGDPLAELSGVQSITCSSQYHQSMPSVCWSLYATYNLSRYRMQDHSNQQERDMASYDSVCSTIAPNQRFDPIELVQQHDAHADRQELEHFGNQSAICIVHSQPVSYKTSIPAATQLIQQYRTQCRFGT